VGNPGVVPLFRCSDCGFVTTASEANAIAAHEQGSPACSGQIDMIADFKSPPAVVLPAARRGWRVPAAPPDGGTGGRPK
jgi:hypothetical protein